MPSLRRQSIAAMVAGKAGSWAMRRVCQQAQAQAMLNRRTQLPWRWGRRSPCA